MKKSILFAAVFFFYTTAMAQFQFDIGVGTALSGTSVQSFLRPYTVAGSNAKDTFYYTYNVSASGFGVYLYPKFHVKKVANHTLSVGAPMMFGLSGSSNSQNGSTLGFLYDVNATIDLNGGRLNRQQDNPDKGFGYFIGLGLGLVNTTGLKYSGGRDYFITKDQKGIVSVPEGGYIDEYMKAKSSGLLLHAGFCIPWKLDKEDEKSIGVRLFVKPKIGQESLSYFGASIYFAFSKKEYF